jgi:tRNA (cytidine/uridine-2'-O-)-methyltransferase
MGRKHNHFVSDHERKPMAREDFGRGPFTIVLLQPRIPQNTGAIARMCAATGSRLHLVNPFFSIEDRQLKRAGLDYWPLLDVRVYPSFDQWSSENAQLRPWFVEVGGSSTYTQVSFQEGDALVFGDEQDGIQPSILSQNPTQHIRIPQTGVRSMNLAMCVGVVCFEGLRQLGWDP